MENPTFEQFQKNCSEGATYPGAHLKNRDEWAYLALGLCGEAGEVGEIVKKALRSDVMPQDDDERMSKLVLEMGDVLWYYARLLDVMGFKIEFVMAENIYKLAQRHKQGTIKER